MINYPVLLINRSFRRKNLKTLFDWVQSHSRGMIIFQHIDEVGESDSIKFYLQKLNPSIEIVVLFAVRKNGERVFVLGGDSQGVYTNHLRKWLSIRINLPFLFIRRSEAEVLYLKLGLNPLAASNVIQDKKNLRLRIDRKTIERCLIFYAENKPSKIEERHGNIIWIKQKLLHAMKHDSVKNLTIWGTIDRRWINELGSILLKQNFYYPKSLDLIQIPSSEERLYRSARGADVLLIGRPLEQFTLVQLGKLYKEMRKPIIIDPFYLFESEELKALGWKYIHP